MSKRYEVAAYENCEIPEPHWLTAGRYETTDKALACARGIIRGSLEHLYRQMGKPDAEALYTRYLCYGEVPAIFGEPKVPFNAYSVVHAYIREITGGRPPPPAGVRW